MNEELKTRPDFEFLAGGEYNDPKFPYRMAKRKAYARGYESCWTTHVEPLQAELNKIRGALVVSNNSAKRRGEENQKLRDLLKDAHETLIIASLIDKSNTCRDSAARIDAALKPTEKLKQSVEVDS